MPAASCDVGEQILEPARLGLRQPRQQLLDALLDRDLLGRQQHRRALLRALEHAAERGQQAEEIDLELGLVRRRRRSSATRSSGRVPLRAAQRLALVQQLGGRLELLVLEQPPHQRLARILLGARRPGVGSGRGSSIRDLMWISVAAITRNSPATSRFSSCISSM